MYEINAPTVITTKQCSGRVSRQHRPLPLNSSLVPRFPTGALWLLSRPCLVSFSLSMHIPSGERLRGEGGGLLLRSAAGEGVWETG